MRARRDPGRNRCLMIPGEDARQSQGRRGSPMMASPSGPRRPCTTPVPGKVVVDLFYTTFCQTSEVESARVRKVAGEFKEDVVLHEYCADDREILLSCLRSPRTGVLSASASRVSLRLPTRWPGLTPSRIAAAGQSA